MEQSRDMLVLGVGVFMMLGLWGLIWMIRRQSGGEESKVEIVHRREDLPWEEMFERAERAVKETVAELPEKVRAEAEKVPWILSKWPPEGESMLGVNMSFNPDRVADAPGPILIYLGSIHEECEECALDFEEEVRITYLHELGHHLGLDEGDLEERGLG